MFSEEAKSSRINTAYFGVLQILGSGDFHGLLGDIHNEVGQQLIHDTHHLLVWFFDVPKRKTFFRRNEHRTQLKREATRLA